MAAADPLPIAVALEPHATSNSPRNGKPVPPELSTRSLSPRSLGGAGAQRPPGSPHSRVSQYGTDQGTVLMVDGLATRPAPNAYSSAFKSGTSIGDAHIKDCARRFSASSEAYVRAGSPTQPQATGSPRGNAAFGSSSSNARDSYVQPLMRGTFGSQRSETGTQSSPRPGSATGTAAFKSGTSGPGEAHFDSVKHRFGESTAAASQKVDGMSQNSGSGAGSVFNSKTSNADAHIKAQPRPVDLCVAYRPAE